MLVSVAPPVVLPVAVGETVSWNDRRFTVGSLDREALVLVERFVRPLSERRFELLRQMQLRASDQPEPEQDASAAEVAAIDAVGAHQRRSVRELEQELVDMPSSFGTRIIRIQAYTTNKMGLVFVPLLESADMEVECKEETLTNNLDLDMGLAPSGARSLLVIDQHVVINTGRTYITWSLQHSEDRKGWTGTGGRGRSA
jgi:hypothetical protein